MQLTLESDLGRVAGVVKQVLDNLPDTWRAEAPQIELALVEAINNAVIHGNQSDPVRQVGLEVSGSESRLEIRVRDEGGEMPEDALERAVMPKALDGSGRGLALIQALAPASSIESGGIVLRWIQA